MASKPHVPALSVPVEFCSRYARVLKELKLSICETADRLVRAHRLELSARGVVNIRAASTSQSMPMLQRELGLESGNLVERASWVSATLLLSAVSAYNEAVSMEDPARTDLFRAHAVTASQIAMMSARHEIKMVE